jgi:hypothetical protein
MGEVMDPYDLVTEEDYDRQRPERMMPDFLLENQEYILRYIRKKNPAPFLATDYIVCLKGIVRSGRRFRAFSKLSEVHFEPVSLDRLPVQRAVGHIQMGGDGIIYSKNIVASFERGYFLDEVQQMYPQDVIGAQVPERPPAGLV